MGNNITKSFQPEELVVKLKQKRNGHGAIVLPDNNILLIGGENHDCLLDSVEIVDIVKKSKATTTIPNLLSKRGYHASTVLDKFVYVIGGRDASNRLNTVQQMDITNPSAGWQNVANMNKARYGSAAATHNNSIFVFGGMDDNYIKLATVECLGTTNLDDGWNLIPSRMKTARYDHAAVIVGNVVYIIGGRDNHYKRLNSVELFDTTTQTIQEGPPLPIPISNTTAVAVGELIVVIGGWTTNIQTIEESYVLDTSTPKSQWERIDVPLQTQRSGHTTVFVNNKLCVCGGHDDGDVFLDTIETIPILKFLPHELKEHVIASTQEPVENCETIDEYDDDNNGSKVDEEGTVICFANCHFLKQLLSSSKLQPLL